jgi:hypothetical protein
MSKTELFSGVTVGISAAFELSAVVGPIVTELFAGGKLCKTYG